MTHRIHPATRPVLALAAAALAATLSSGVQAQQAPLKVGLMLPATGTYAALGTAIQNGFKLYVEEQGGKLGGRSIEYFFVDDESAPPKATDNVNKLIKRDNVDVIVGTVHSGVAVGMARAVKGTDKVLIVPNAGADAITGPLCAPNILRSSFSNWQPGYATGVVAAQKGYKKAMTITWKYSAGAETVAGFREAFEKGGGKVVEDLDVPFPNVEFQALLTKIASEKPDVVYAFFAGGGAVKFVKDWAAAGLKGNVVLMGSGFLTDGTLDGQGDAAQGVVTALHYADGIDTPRNNDFRNKYAVKYKMAPDVYAVQGYDAAQILANGLKAVKGDFAGQHDAMLKAMRTMRVDSPRGAFTLSAAGNPVQDFYIREVKGRENVASGVAIKGLADPAKGCKL